MMSAPLYTTIVVELFSELDTLLNHYIYNGYHNVAHALKLPLSIAITLYIVLMGIAINQGWTKLTFPELTKSAVKIALVYLFAMHWDVFSEYAVKGVTQSAMALGNILVNSNPLHLPHFGGAGLIGGLQSIMIEITKISVWTWHLGSFTSPSPYFTASLIWLFGYASLMIGIVEIVAAKVMLAVLFTTAPLFIAFTLFKPTQGFFDRWIGAIVGFAFVMIFVSAMLGLTITITQWAIGTTYIQHALGIKLIGFIPFMVVGIVGIVLIFKMAGMAQSIGGVVTTSSGSTMAASLVGSFIGSSLGASRLGRSLLSRPISKASDIAHSGLGFIHKNIQRVTQTDEE